MNAMDVSGALPLCRLQDLTSSCLAKEFPLLEVGTEPAEGFNACRKRRQEG